MPFRACYLSSTPSYDENQTFGFLSENINLKEICRIRRPKMENIRVLYENTYQCIRSYKPKANNINVLSNEAGIAHAHMDLQAFRYRPHYRILHEQRSLPYIFHLQGFYEVPHCFISAIQNFCKHNQQYFLHA